MEYLFRQWDEATQSQSYTLSQKYEMRKHLEIIRILTPWLETLLDLPTEDDTEISECFQAQVISDRKKSLKVNPNIFVRNLIIENQIEVDIKLLDNIKAGGKTFYELVFEAACIFGDGDADDSVMIYTATFWRNDRRALEKLAEELYQAVKAGDEAVFLLIDSLV